MSHHPSNPPPAFSPTPIEARLLSVLERLESFLDRQEGQESPWLSVNQVRQRYRIDPDELRRVIAAGKVQARPHLARGGHKSVLVHRASLDLIYGAALPRRAADS